MLNSRDVYAAAEAVIGLVGDARKDHTFEDAPPRGAKGGFYTLEGAVADVLYRHLDMPFEPTVGQAVERARDEVSSSKPFGSNSWLAKTGLMRRSSVPDSTQPYRKSYSPRARRNPRFLTRSRHISRKTPALA